MHGLVGGFAAGAATIVLFAATSAFADYSTGTTHCMTQHDFCHCHAVCADRVDHPANNPAASAEHGKLTDEEQFVTDCRCEHAARCGRTQASCVQAPESA